jgi:hypothetical protein
MRDTRGDAAFGVVDPHPNQISSTGTDLVQRLAINEFLPPVACEESDITQQQGGSSQTTW